MKKEIESYKRQINFYKEKMKRDISYAAQKLESIVNNNTDDHLASNNIFKRISNMSPKKSKTNYNQNISKIRSKYKTNKIISYNLSENITNLIEFNLRKASDVEKSTEVPDIKDKKCTKEKNNVLKSENTSLMETHSHKNITNKTIDDKSIILVSNNSKLSFENFENRMNRNRSTFKNIVKLNFNSTRDNNPIKRNNVSKLKNVR